MPNYLDSLRSALGPNYASMGDEELLQKAAEATGRDPLSIARDFGVGQDRGKTGSRVSSAIDSYQANLYGLGEAVTGSEWMRDRRQANELGAEIASDRARQLGAVDRWDDVHGPGDFGDYAVGLGIQSAPYLGEALVGGVAARGLSAGLRTAARAGSEEAAKSLATRSAMGGAAASYPSAVGDILGNQREQLRQNGQDDSNVDVGSALAWGVPYAGLNMLSPAERIVSGAGAPRVASYLDKGTGLTGGLKRMGANGAILGFGEGVNETGQEMINQYGGRMAVDPNETLFSDSAMGRYKESFIGGATLGGVMGGAVGGWRRSDKWYEDQLAEHKRAEDAAKLEQGGSADMLSGSGAQTSTALTVIGNRAVVPFAEDATGANRIEQPEQTFGFGQELPALPAPIANQSTQNQGAPGVLNVTSSGTVAPMGQLSGQQYDMFGGAPDTFGNAGPSVEGMRDPTIGRPMPAQSIAVNDGQTQDALGIQPAGLTKEEADAQLAMHPALEAATKAANLQAGRIASNSDSAPRGAIAGDLRSAIIQRLGKLPAYGVKLAHDVAGLIHNTDAAQQFLTEQTEVLNGALEKVTKKLQSLDKKVSMGSDMLTPEEYAERRKQIDAEQSKLEENYLALLAMSDAVSPRVAAVIEERRRLAINQMARVGQQKAAPGKTASPRQSGNATEQSMRQANVARQADEVTARSTPNEMDPNLVKERGPAPLTLSRQTQSDLDQMNSRERWAAGPERQEPAPPAQPGQGSLITANGNPTNGKLRAIPKTKTAAPNEGAAPVSQTAPVESGGVPAPGAPGANTGPQQARSDDLPGEPAKVPDLSDADRKKVAKMESLSKKYEMLLECLARKS